MNFNVTWGMLFTSNAPTMVKTTAGRPKIIIKRLSKPCLKNVILPRFPKTWKIATSTRAVWKSRKKSEIGRNSVDEPKPAMVPAISDASAPSQKRELTINGVTHAGYKSLYGCLTGVAGVHSSSSEGGVKPISAMRPSASRAAANALYTNSALS